VAVGGVQFGLDDGGARRTFIGHLDEHAFSYPDDDNGDRAARGARVRVLDGVGDEFRGQ